VATAPYSVAIEPSLAKSPLDTTIWGAYESSPPYTGCQKSPVDLPESPVLPQKSPILPGESMLPVDEPSRRVHYKYIIWDLRRLQVQPIPLGVTFSNAVSKLEAQSSNVYFH